METPDTNVLAKIVQENLNDGVILTDQNGLIVWVNPAFEQLCGYDLADLIGRKPGKVLQGPGTTETSKEVLRRSIKTQKKCVVEILNYNKSGEMYLAEISLFPILDKSATLTNFVAVQRNISRERNLSQQSIDFRAYRRALDEQAIVSITDTKGRITYVNQKFCSISGYEPDELVGQTHRIVNSGNHDRSFFREMWEKIRNGGVWHGEVCNKTKEGKIYWVDTTVVPVHGEDGETLRYVSTRFDITERKNAEGEIARLAQTDPLTGLANRTFFASILRSALKQEEACGLIAIIDLDHFKDVNESIGHHNGDLLLKEIAEDLTVFLGEGATVARLGGDEFAVIAPGYARGRARKFIDGLSREVGRISSIGGMDYKVTCSMGVARYPAHGRTAESLLMNADIALYDAKSSGRNTCRYFSRKVGQQVDHKNKIKRVIERALKHDGFDIALQPFCCAQTGRHVGFEVLARLLDDDRAIPPDQFIRVAEEYDLISDIGRVISSRAMSFVQNMKIKGRSIGIIAINVAGQQLRNTDFVEEVQDLLFQYGLLSSDLILEITETSLIGRDTNMVAENLRTLQETGVRVALDDFGTGFSSLAHLKNFSVDKIKIDKSFVNGLTTGSEEQALVAGIIQLARCLNLEVVAEGVETGEQLELIKKLGANFIQGYVHSHPLTVSQAELFLNELDDVCGLKLA